MSRGLSKSVVDIFFQSFSQVPGDRSGPVGRIVNAKNVIVTHYDAGQGAPQRVKVQQRNGFATLATTGRSTEDAELVTLLWDNPELLTTLGNQLLSVPNARPRVYNGTEWSAYPFERVVSNQLSESVFHTSQRTIQAPDSAVLDGVTCSVWTETLGSTPAFVITYIGFKAADGTWLVTPQILYDPGTDVTDDVVMARVTTDGTVFWVTFNTNTAGRQLEVRVYDTTGELLATDATLDADAATPGPGYWDITPEPTGDGIVIAQPGNANGSGTGALITLATYAANVITLNTNFDATINCNGPIAFLTNDLGDGFTYIVVLDVTLRMWGYQITGNAQTHEFDFDLTFVFTPDSLIGWMEVGENPGEPTMFVTSSNLANAVASTGPPHDPALRYMRTYSLTWADVYHQERQINSLIAVSRAFLHDDDYYAMTYYQSGSGFSTPSSLSVEITEDDYMIGPSDQPLDLNTTPFTSWTEGSPFAAPSPPTGPFVFVTNGQGSQPILAGDTVANHVGAGDPGLIDGVLYSLFTFANATFNSRDGSKLVISGSGMALADGEYIVVFALGVTQAYCWPVGHDYPVGTFAGTGNFQIDKMVRYPLDAAVINEKLISTQITDSFYNGTSATIAVTGSAAPNNGTKSVYYLSLPGEFETIYSSSNAVAYVNWGAEVASGSAYVAIVSPSNPNQWRLGVDGGFDDTYIGAILFIEGDTQIPGNNGEHEITGGGNLFLITGGITESIVAEYIITPPTMASIHLPIGVFTPYTFFFADLTLDFTFIGAVLSIQGATHSENNGTYVITDVDPVTGIFHAQPTNGLFNQRNEGFSTDPAPTVTIFLSGNVSPQFQPLWEMTPLKGGTPDGDPQPPSGPLLWLKSDVIESSGSDLTLWPDQSGNSRDATVDVSDGFSAPTITPAKLDGKPGLLYEDHGNAASTITNYKPVAPDQLIASGAARTLFVVCIPSNARGGWLFQWDGGTGNNIPVYANKMWKSDGSLFYPPNEQQGYSDENFLTTANYAKFAAVIDYTDQPICIMQYNTDPSPDSLMFCRVDNVDRPLTDGLGGPPIITPEDINSNGYVVGGANFHTGVSGAIVAFDGWLFEIIAYAGDRSGDVDFMSQMDTYLHFRYPSLPPW